MPDYGRTLEPIYVDESGHLGNGRFDGMRPIVIRLSEPRYLEVGPEVQRWGSPHYVTHALLNFEGRTMGFPFRFGPGVTLEQVHSRHVLWVLLKDYHDHAGRSYASFLDEIGADDDRQSQQDWRDLNLLNAKLERVLDSVLEDLVQDIPALEE